MDGMGGLLRGARNHHRRKVGLFRVHMDVHVQIHDTPGHTDCSSAVQFAVDKAEFVKLLVNTVETFIRRCDSPSRASNCTINQLRGKN